VADPYSNYTGFSISLIQTPEQIDTSNKKKKQKSIKNIFNSGFSKISSLFKFFLNSAKDKIVWNIYEFYYWKKLLMNLHPVKIVPRYFTAR